MNQILNKIIEGFNFEKESDLYEKIGVNPFKRILPMGSFWINLFNQVFNKNFHIITSRENALFWLTFTLAVELLHIIALVFSIYFILKFNLENEYVKMFKTIFSTLVINIYPIFIQRYNRIRIIEIYKINKDEIKNLKLKSRINKLTKLVLTTTTRPIVMNCFQNCIFNHDLKLQNQ